MLGFANEKEARARLLLLADERRQVKRRIDNTQRKLDSLNQNNRH